MHTHELTFGGGLVVKRYRSWARGEHRREWASLRQVHRFRPDLGPRPVAADLDADPPTVTMTVVPGEPLPERPSPQQIDALATGVRSLWTVPPPEPHVRPDDLGLARRLVDGRRPVGAAAASAYDAAVAWWRGPDPSLLSATPTDSVLGHRDPNLANYLWDGQTVRIVDYEDAALSDPANEVALLVEHVSARALDPSAVCDRFEVDPVRLRAARRLWAMFWLWLLLPGGPSHSTMTRVEAQARRVLSLLAD